MSSLSIAYRIRLYQSRFLLAVAILGLLVLHGWAEDTPFIQANEARGTAGRAGLAMMNDYDLALLSQENLATLIDEVTSAGYGGSLPSNEQHRIDAADRWNRDRGDIHWDAAQEHWWVGIDEERPLDDPVWLRARNLYMSAAEYFADAEVIYEDVWRTLDASIEQLEADYRIWYIENYQL